MSHVKKLLVSLLIISAYVFSGTANSSMVGKSEGDKTSTERFKLTYGVEIEVNPAYHPKFDKMIELYAPRLDLGDMLVAVKKVVTLPEEVLQGLDLRNKKEKFEIISKWWNKQKNKKELFDKIKKEYHNGPPRLLLVSENVAKNVLSEMNMEDGDIDFFYEKLKDSNKEGVRKDIPTLSVDPNNNYEFRGFIFDSITDYKKWTDLFKEYFQGGDIQGHIVWNGVGEKRDSVLKHWPGTSLYLHDRAMLERIKDECHRSKSEEGFIPFTNGSSKYLGTIGQSNMSNMLGPNGRERIGAPIFGNESYGKGSNYGLEFRQYDNPSENFSLDPNSFDHLYDGLKMLSDVYQKDGNLDHFAPYERQDLVPPDSTLGEDCDKEFKFSTLIDKAKLNKINSLDVECYKRYKKNVSSFLGSNLSMYAENAKSSSDEQDIKLPEISDMTYRKLVFLAAKAEKETKKKKQDRKIPLFELHNFLFPLRNWLKDYPATSKMSSSQKKLVAQKSIAYYKNLLKIVSDVPDDCLGPVVECDECQKHKMSGVATLPINSCELAFSDENIAEIINKARIEVAKWGCEGEILNNLIESDEAYLNKKR